MYILISGPTLVEDDTGVREASRVVEGTEGNDFTGREGVEEEASSEHLGGARRSGAGMGF